VNESRLRAWLMGAYFLAIIVWFAWAGVTLDKQIILGLVLGALAVWSVGRPWSEIRRLVLEWLPFVAALVVYDAARSGAHALGRPVAVTPQLDADRILFLGTVPTVWLQRQFYDANRVHWYDVVATLVYVSHFLAAFVTAGWLWSRSRAAWALFATRFFMLCFAGALTFAIIPAAPPWAASQTFHKLGPVTRLADHGWSALHLEEPEVLLQQGRDLANPYAAIPSLHAGWAVLVVIALWPFVRRRTRWLLAAYPVLMAVTLVYTGEHYVADIIVGWAYVAGVILVERRTGASDAFLNQLARWSGPRRRSADTPAVP
jgi:membrane-associated phospholipid phosphatase